MKKILKFLLAFCALLLLGRAAHAQGYRIGDSLPISSSLVNPGVISTAQGTINFCAHPASGVPCANKVNTFTDATLGTACPTSTQIVLVGTNTCVNATDVRGNWGVWIGNGTYDFTITVPTGQSFGPYTITVGVTSGGNISAGTISATGQITSTVATGTAPLVIASTTLVPNLNAQFHNGLTAPGSAIVGVSDTQTLTNKTLTGASSGNAVTLVCAQAPSVAITGNSSAQQYYSCTIPASTVGTLKGVRFTAGNTHSGSTSVQYTATLNGQNLYTYSTNGGAPMMSGVILNTGATSGTVTAFTVPSTSDSVASLSSLSWSSSQTLSFLFNVANTDTVTPIQLVVELIQ